mmetsp:Transcript_17583/g.38068  ORF Transcript_17583/g.38068 Transcript_17583/m.38068 type:complete len:510 (+) Transcript_17583:32-1561(+)
MMNFLCQSLVGMGLQITVAMASSAFGSVVAPPPVETLVPPSLGRFYPPTGDTHRKVLAFATRRQPSRRSHNGRGPIISRTRLAPFHYTKSDDEILTPATFADSRSAKHQVKDVITSKACEAFDSTDFAHEPHLSPELEDAEAAYEVALLASAAHELADMAEKENRQSRAAMLEREKELEWIEKHNINSEDDDDDDGAAARKAEVFQRALLAAQLSNVKSQRASKQRRQEEFQRSLLSARIANDAKLKAANFADERRLSKEEWLGSEVRAASMGGRECLPFDVASAAASTAAENALADAEAEKNGVVVAAVKEDDGNDDAPVAAASMLADAAERMILGEDIAYFEHSPESPSREIDLDEVKQRPVLEVVDYDGSINFQTQLSVQKQVLSEVDQWRKDYAHEIRNYVQQKGIEQTKEKLSLRSSAGGDDTSVDDGDNVIVDSIDATIGATPSEQLVVKDADSGNDGVIKRALQRGFIRRMRQRRMLLSVALAVVVSRRLFLAYFGNALRLI